MAREQAETVFCYYRVIGGREEELLKLCHEHDATLRKLGLVTDEPMALYGGEDQRGRPLVIKLFQWKSPRALDAARQHPDVQAIWERMDTLCEARDGQPNMEFPHLARVV